MEFKVSNKAKIFSIILIVIGLISLLAGIFTDHSDHAGQRLWANVLINGYFFFLIPLGALFFIALQYVSEMGWGVTTKRIFEGISSFLPIPSLVLIIVFIAGSMHWHHIYHWMDNSVLHEYVVENTIDSAHPEYVDELVDGVVENEHYDSIIANKTAYLNQGFFWGRTIVYFAVFLFFMFWFRKKSVEEDQIGGLSVYKKSIIKGVIFMVFFAYTSSSSSWDWIMSIDTHWFSTLFGWYTFSGMFVSTIIVSILIVFYLKTLGLLKEVNSSHIHDLGKWMFAISMLWCYLWFSQFMLIWYSDIPEEVTYYIERFTHYKYLYVGTFALNFVLPFFVLMSRDAKKNPIFIVPVAIILYVAHWIDVVVMVLPGTLHEHGHIGMLEIGMFLMFTGVMIISILTAISKRPLMPKNHPFYDESLHLDT